MQASISNEESQIKYSFQGVNFKWELIASAFLVLIAIPLFFIGLYLRSLINPEFTLLDYSGMRVLPFIAQPFLMTLLLYKFYLGKKFSWTWNISLYEQEKVITILERSNTHQFSFEDLKVIYVTDQKNLPSKNQKDRGMVQKIIDFFNQGRRTFFIKSGKQKLRVTVGTMILTPFSTKQDIVEMDRIMERLDFLLKKNNYQYRSRELSKYIAQLEYFREKKSD